MASVVPRPISLSALGGEPVVLSEAVTISSPPELEREARWFGRLLEEGAGRRVSFRPGGERADISLSTGLPVPALSVEGAYRLRAADGAVEVVGDSSGGVFYGLQSLRQLLPPASFRRARLAQLPLLAIDPVEIEDRPRFSWRGVHLDVSRHFMPKAFLLKLVDLAALHKLNVFHLHLTDDQGWRVPVTKYPRLTEVGAWRRESSAGHLFEGRFDGTPHGGFYSPEDLAEVVCYAAERHVSVLPEVDVPGHTVAAIAAYPELGAGGEVEVLTRWGISEHVLNLDEATVQFCRDVVDEVAALFPGEYFHLGGDECPTAEWAGSQRAAEIMAENGFSDLRQLQGWFTAQMAEHLAGLGRRLVGWDEILEGGAPPGSVVMSWRGEDGGIAAAAAGHDVVMAPQEWLYFDWPYSTGPEEPLAIWGCTPLEKVYGYEPVSPRIPEASRHHVLGAQCQLWTEYVSSAEHAEYLYFPRLCAFAEAVWSPASGRSFGEFTARLPAHLERLEALGVNYRPLAGPTPGQARIWLDPRQTGGQGR